MQLDNGLEAVVWPLRWGSARLCLRAPGSRYHMNEWHYESPYAALTALEGWTGKGDPSGWHRNPLTGRWRPEGDPTREYVRY